MSATATSAETNILRLKDRTGYGDVVEAVISEAQIGFL